MKVETVKVNGVMVNKGEEHLAKKFAQFPKNAGDEEWAAQISRAAEQFSKAPEQAEEPAAEVVEEPKKPRR